MGVRLFEKHFTYDKKAPGFDHKHAQDLEGLGKYIDVLGRCDKAIKWDSYQMDSGQLETRIRARRGVYAAKDLPAGHILLAKDL